MATLICYGVDISHKQFNEYLRKFIHQKDLNLTFISDDDLRDWAEENSDVFDYEWYPHLEGVIVYCWHHLHDGYIRQMNMKLPEKTIDDFLKWLQLNDLPNEVEYYSISL